MTALEKKRMKTAAYIATKLYFLELQVRTCETIAAYAGLGLVFSVLAGTVKKHLETFVLSCEH